MELSTISQNNNHTTAGRVYLWKRFKIIDARELKQEHGPFPNTVRVTIDERKVSSFISSKNENKSHAEAESVPKFTLRKNTEEMQVLSWKLRRMKEKNKLVTQVRLVEKQRYKNPKRTRRKEKRCRQTRRRYLDLERMMRRELSGKGF